MRLGKLVAAVGMTVALSGVPVVAAAQTDPYVRRPPVVGGSDEGRQAEVGGVDISRDAPAADPRRAVSSRGQADTNTLPVTGGDVFGLTAIGLASIGIGTVLVRRARRRAVA